jgi:hypothetical protein
MSTQTKVVTVIIAIVIAIGLFYAGDVYGKSQAPMASTPGANNAGQYTRAGGRGGTGGSRVAGGAVGGSILSLTPTSMTVSLVGGGSRIVLLAPSTMVLKSTTGTLSDLTVGANVNVQGTANSDGSVSATSVQIRPAGAMRPQGSQTPTPASQSGM